MDRRPIGVFDSGLGGLTAVRELARIIGGTTITETTLRSAEEMLG